MSDTKTSVSVLDAIKDGQWDFEPAYSADCEYDSTAALPGTDAKLDTLAERAASGLPLWHPSDRRTYDDSDSIE